MIPIWENLLYKSISVVSWRPLANSVNSKIYNCFFFKFDGMDNNCTIEFQCALKVKEVLLAVKLLEVRVLC